MIILGELVGEINAFFVLDCDCMAEFVTLRLPLLQTIHCHILLILNLLFFLLLSLLKLLLQL